MILSQQPSEPLPVSSRKSAPVQERFSDLSTARLSAAGLIYFPNGREKNMFTLLIGEMPSISDIVPLLLVFRSSTSAPARHHGFLSRPMELSGLICPPNCRTNTVGRSGVEPYNLLALQKSRTTAEIEEKPGRKRKRTLE